MDIKYIFQILSVFLCSINFLRPECIMASEGEKILNKAILDDAEAGIKEAVQLGAQINFENENKSPLLKAVLLKKKRAVKGLLKAEANPNIVYLGKPYKRLFCIFYLR